MDAPADQFHEIGAVTDKIDVEISFQIIGLFSEGLYSSPNKAIEELVSNSFDADATNVQVVMSADRGAPDATIAVIDNGTGMDALGLKVHWIVGDSKKSRSTNQTTKSGRKAIGKFGIGKLAAYVLGQRLTHITKAEGKFYSTTMDFRRVPRNADVDAIGTPRPHDATTGVTLDLRELTEAEAAEATHHWLTKPEGRTGLDLFGERAEPSWTVAIISDLKPLASDLTAGRLRWVLATAMPLRDDFALFLNSERVESSKLDADRIGTWTIGKDLTSLPKPAPTEIQLELNDLFPTSDYRRWVLVDTLLGPISGYLEIFSSPIDKGKSDLIVGRSNGFFVYVHGRLINPEDAGFGIDRNSLRHGTFSRFRVVINLDRLNDELRSSRESLRDGPRLERARDILKALFNFARGQLEAHETNIPEQRRASQRLGESPASLTERPLLSMVLDAFDDSYSPRHLSNDLFDRFNSRDALKAFIEERLQVDDGLVAKVNYQDLGTYEPLAVLEPVSGDLSINLEHPFVAYFADEFGDSKRNLPLQLLAISEVLLEAQLHDAGVELDSIRFILDSRDELLRHLARTSGFRSSLSVAQDLVNNASNAKGLESALVQVFLQLGYEAVPKAGNDEADGLAEAFLPASELGERRYRVSLEAKSKETPGGKVKKKAVEVSTIARHRDEANCDHAIVVGPDFETGADDYGAVVREIDADRLANPSKTITLMRISDLATLVRIAPLKRANLSKLRELFDARTPLEASAWVAELSRLPVEQAPYQAILEGVWELQKDDGQESVTYDSLRVALKMSGKLIIKTKILRDECFALSRMAPDLFVSREDKVELNIRPDKVLEVIHEYVDCMSEDDQP